jgi:hypothetical protein
VLIFLAERMRRHLLKLSPEEKFLFSTGLHDGPFEDLLIPNKDLSEIMEGSSTTQEIIKVGASPIADTIAKHTEDNKTSKSENRRIKINNNSSQYRLHERADLFRK